MFSINERGFKMMDKKAVSAVVATVLIILITIAAVTIIWSAIIPMIQNNISGSGDCLDASGQISLIEDVTCKNSTNIKIGVSRLQGNFQLASIVAKVYDSTGNSYSAESTDTNIVNIAMNTQKVIIFNTTNFAVADFNNIVKVNLAPKIKLGTTTKECNLVREVVLRNCTA
jgi:FlaG/FlaF family flagellin (archaellin)